MGRRISDYERLGRDADDDGFEDEERPRHGHRAKREEMTVLLDEPRFVVVAKPSGLPSVPERFAPDAPTAIDHAEALLRREDPGAARPIVVHRLDRDTSGALVLAKDDAATRDLMAQLEARTVRKGYLALVTGAPHPPAGSVEFRVEEDPRRKGAMRLAARGGRECASDYETLEAFRAVSLVRVLPRTGRTHQVRLTLVHLGTPCAIDPLYGSTEPILLSTWKRDYRLGRGRIETPLIERLTLHAEWIEFRRPGGDDADPAARVRVECPLPRDFATALRQLRRWAQPGSL